MQIAYDNTANEIHADDIVFDDTAAVARFDMGSVLASVHRHLDGHQILGQDWPADAVYAAKYRTTTWPCGWDKHDSVRFFSNSDELSRFVRSMNNWSTEEDNGWEFTLYMWDLGPELINDVAAHVY